MSGRHQQRSMRFAVFAATLFALVSVAVLLSQRNTGSAEPAPVSAAPSPIDRPADLVESAGVVNADEVALAPRGVESAPVEPGPSQPSGGTVAQPQDPDDPAIADALEQVAKSETDLDLAMQGDIEAADRLASYINRGCRHAPRSTEALNRTLDTFQRSLAQADSVSARRNFEASIHGTTVMFHACAKILETVGNAGEDIKRLAQSGDVVARYIYALWPPELANEDSPLLAQTEWELLARDFIFQNIESGEPLGLVALGGSYNSGTFTPQNNALGLGLLMAAANCGLVHPPTEKLLKRLAESSDEQKDYFFRYNSDQFGPGV
ncbi:hypothetical protein F3N42_11595 [Marinihelvus fidelis]|uniref:Uncharacterized protein n=1 Tax=Marinihelvus fidelis TaxID=2613842 RepID=A0A5N0TAZ7_9GAMM|nr:hypothetical protein [Marinihelvus fidelis]KAA9130986.1 hypothetical protein F3N42_11595 [Marinihelvus fidelis]